MGISYKHDSDFYIKRPDGSGDNLLLVFKTDAFILLDNTKIHVGPDSAIVYSKNYPQFYGSCAESYENHFVHFECNETDIFFETIGMKFNRPICVPDISAAENVLKMLSLESMSENENSSECINLLLRLLIAKISDSGEKALKSAHSEKLRSLRAEIYSTPAGKFTVSELAECLSLSPSHFQTVYKEEFGVSCYEDVLRAKINSAKYYLKNTSLSVNEISELCGYENNVHFIRQFKQRTGVTALEYRNNSET